MSAQSKRSQLLALRAHEMRAELTFSEAALWRALAGSRLDGVRFRRQVVIADRFIVDFLAPRQKLVVEVDGGYHQRRQAQDARRDAKLARLGYRVLRLEEALVLHSLPDALARIRAALGQ